MAHEVKLVHASLCVFLEPKMVDMGFFIRIGHVLKVGVSGKLCCLLIYFM